MNWFKCKIRLGKTDCVEYLRAINDAHARVMLCMKYGERISASATIDNIGSPAFMAFKVEIHFRNSIEQRNVLAIEKEHVQSNIYKEYRKKEIIKLIIHGKDDYGGP